MIIEKRSGGCFVDFEKSDVVLGYGQRYRLK
jgi:hypothetical protein